MTAATDWHVTPRVWICSWCDQVDDREQGRRCPCRSYVPRLRSARSAGKETAEPGRSPQRGVQPQQSASVTDPVRRSAPADPPGKSWGR